MLYIVHRLDNKVFDWVSYSSWNFNPMLFITHFFQFSALALYFLDLSHEDFFNAILFRLLAYRSHIQSSSYCSSNLTSIFFSCFLHLRLTYMQQYLDFLVSQFYRQWVAFWVLFVHSCLATCYFSFLFFFFFFHWHYSPLWAVACRTMSFQFLLSATNSLHLLTPRTWRSLSTSSFHLLLGLPLLLVPSSTWVKIFFGASYSPPFSLGDLTSLSFALSSILLYFLPCSSFLVLDSSYFSIPCFHI